MEDLLVSLACQLIVSKTELKIVVQKTQNRRSATTFSQKTSLAELNWIALTRRRTWLGREKDGLTTEANVGTGNPLKYSTRTGIENSFLSFSFKKIRRFTDE